LKLGPDQALILKLAIHRFFTFPQLHEWKKVSPRISREDLANSGFLWLSSQVGAQCFHCFLVLRSFDLSKHVDDLHRELSPECPLMAGKIHDVPISDPTNFRYESHRLYSLLTTEWTSPVCPYGLAKYGFYWTGSTDNCRCAFCRLEVRGWEEGDRADAEHRRWNPNCVFMNNRSVGNVLIGRELSEHSLSRSVETTSSYSINPFAHSENSKYGLKYPKSTAQVPVETLGVTPINPPRHPNFMSTAKREESFKLWPLGMSQKPNQLVEAGFYYTGNGDRVICFQCGGGLKDWARNDTPWEEHAKWFSRCPYLLLKKGKDFVDQIHRDQKIEMPVEAFLEAMTPISYAHEQEADPSKTAIAGRLLCLLCHERAVETVNLPCGHMVACEACIEQQHACKRCNKPRIAYVRAFL
jgi:E3 ubiquitin-protein ligase XIAP